MTAEIVDLFAGAGGWDLAAIGLGMDPLGVEIDPDACATRHAVGLSTRQADVLDVDLGTHQLAGLIASPPCPAFSAAGTRSGLPDIARLVELLDRDRIGADHCWQPHRMHAHGQIGRDAMLCVEPLRWVDRHQPEWVAFEQVRAVLPIWEAAGRWLETRYGYHTWTGILCAADYGVPQERYRAILLAHRQHSPGPPPPTHRRPAEHPELFTHELDDWLPAAAVLEPHATTSDTAINTGQNTETAAGVYRYSRTIDRPSPTVTTKALGQWVLNQYGDTGHRPPRPVERAAPTITTKANRWEWCLDQREHYKPLRSLRRPVPTVTGSSVNNWILTRPATTVTTDPRLWPPGHRINRHDISRHGATEARRRYVSRDGRTAAIKLTPAQAGQLQSFPPDYPWQGTKTAQARQIGNAVPPLLAHHILTHLTNGQDHAN